MTEFLHHIPNVDAGHTYTVTVTHLSIRNPWRIPAFFRAIRPVLAQFSLADGMTGGGVRTRWSRLDFWTYAAFDSADALQRFLHSGPHGAVAHRLRGRLGPLHSRQVALTGDRLPRCWEDAATLLTDSRPEAIRR